MKNAKFRYVEGGYVWEITKTNLPLEQQLGSVDAHTSEVEEEEMRWKEGKEFMVKLHEFLSPYMSRADQATLLAELVKSISETYTDMTYTEEYLRPTSDALVKFLDAEKAKQKGE